MQLSIQQTKSKRLTPDVLRQLGAINIDESKVAIQVWQIGLLQYASQLGGSYQLWDEEKDWYVTDAISVRYLHELLIQYYGLTFKNLTNG